jgi:hypothetical protein
MWLYQLLKTLKRNKIMPTKKYEIYVKGILSFVKYTRQDFDRVCSDMDKLSVNYTTKIISLI